MNPEKVGKLLKKIRNTNNLTQKELADKLGVTYQAVSKWETGKSIPDITIIRQISKDFGISVESILDGEYNKKIEKKKHPWILISLPIIIIIIIVLIIGIVIRTDNTFKFKTITSKCSGFKVSGSIAYNQKKSSIYISNINYCGEEDKTEYKTIKCTLYESNKSTKTIISDCKTKGQNKTLESYLKDVEINIDNYYQTCKKYSDESLYLEIEATSKTNRTVMYKIPLKLNDNCQNNKK